MSLVEFDLFLGQRGLDHVGIEDIAEGQDLRLVEGFDLVLNPPSCSLGHRRPP